jgi:hypothetical protein
MRTLVALIVLRSLGSGSTSGPNAQATVYVDGTAYTAAQVVAGEVEISEGVFIAAVRDKDNMEALLEAANQSLSWEPSSIMTALGFFSGTMNQDQIIWFLSSGEVYIIEEDGVVTIAEEETTTGEVVAEKTTTGPDDAQATVHVDGIAYTVAQVVAGEVEISEGVFIVSVRNKDNMEALLEAANQSLSWEPSSIMTALGMFAGTMNQDQILWLLRSGEVNFIEEDVVVTIGGQTSPHVAGTGDDASGALTRSPAFMILLYVMVLQ